MKHHKSDYLILALLSGLYIIGVYKFQTQPRFVLSLTAGYGLIYFLWGIFHEFRSHNLRVKVVLEYFLVALLGAVIVSTLLV